MGCFLGCFGFTQKKRRPKGSSKNASEHQSCGKYVPLDSDVTVKLDCGEMQKASDTKLRDKLKESSSTAKIMKKVSFNLNVKAYEPLPNDEIGDYFSEGEEKTMWEYNQEETAGASMKYMNCKESLMGSKFGPFPSNYRYENCSDRYYEEDEIELEESDLDDDDEDELDFDEDDICESFDYRSQKISQTLMEEEEKVSIDQLAEERRSNLMQHQTRQHQELNKTESNQNARNRTQIVFSVLTPVENLTQWKEVKVKSRQQLKDQKENIMLEQEQHIPSRTIKGADPLALKSSADLNHFNPQSREIAVDASLSNWLVSSNAKDINAAITNAY